MGDVGSQNLLELSLMRFFNVIPEKFPPYAFSSNGEPLHSEKNELVRLISLHWLSSHYIVPVLEQESFESMLGNYLSGNLNDNVWAETSDDTPSILKAVLFAVAALSAKYNQSLYLPDFYYHLVRSAIDASDNTASFEFLLANTLLVFSFPVWLIHM